MTIGLVSVIMSNYNTPEDYLRQSIDSILGQTYSNFEFIIVDDASTDGSLAVIESYKDPRIRIIKNSENLGLTKSLNIALDECRGEYIARMDSDDISLPERFEKQVTFLQSNPDVIVCGTWAKYIGNWKAQNSNDGNRRLIPDRETFKIYQLFGNDPNIVHPSAMFNNAKLKANGIRYNEKYRYAQDYRMWISCNEESTCAIITEDLIEYRVENTNVSSLKKDQQADCVFGIIQEQLDKLHLSLHDEIKSFHYLFLTSRKPYDLRIKKWIKTLISSNKKYNIYDKRQLNDILWKKWAEIVYFALYSATTKAKISLLIELPIGYWPELLKIRRSRAKRRQT